MLAGVLLVILSMGVATSWSFGRGFLGYINEQALERMAPVLPRQRAPMPVKAAGNSAAISRTAGSRSCDPSPVKIR